VTSIDRDRASSCCITYVIDQPTHSCTEAQRAVGRTKSHRPRPIHGATSDRMNQWPPTVDCLRPAACEEHLVEGVMVRPNDQDRIPIIGSSQVRTSQVDRTTSFNRFTRLLVLCSPRTGCWCPFRCAVEPGCYDARQRALDLAEDPKNGDGLEADYCLHRCSRVWYDRTWYDHSSARCRG
jgi:hypothetical protein